MNQPFELGSKVKRFSLIKQNMIVGALSALLFSGLFLFGDVALPADILAYLGAAIFGAIGLITLYQSFRQLWVDVYDGGLMTIELLGQRKVLLWRDVAEVELKRFVTSFKLSRTHGKRLNTSLIFLTRDDQVFDFSFVGAGNELVRMIVMGVAPHLLPTTLKALEAGEEVYVHELISYDRKGVIYFRPETEEQLLTPKEKHIPWDELKVAFDSEHLFIKADGIPFLSLPVPEIVNYFIFLDVVQRNNIEIKDHRHELD